MTQAAEQLIETAAAYQRLQAAGRLCSATLTGLRATGPARDGDPELELELTVDVDGTPVHVAHRQVVSRLAAGELRLGRHLLVRVDRADPTVLVLA
jgi:hypothetical protein